MQIGQRFLRAVSAALVLAAAVLAATALSPAGPSPARAAAAWESQALPPELDEGCSTLTGVWGSSDSDVFAVASCGALLHYDGQAWARLDPGPLAAADPEAPPCHLSALWGASPTELFIGGTGYSDLQGPHAAVYRFSESRWTAWALVPGDSARINGLWGSGASDNVYAVGGEDGGGFVYCWNGAYWTRRFSCETSQSLSEVELRGVWGSSDNNLFVVGGGLKDASRSVIVHYDGSQWSPVDTGPTNRLSAVWGDSGSDIFAVGDGGAILHYDGAAWVPQESGTEADLTAVWGSSAPDVYAAGRDPRAGTAAILHYDGLAWSPIEDVTARERLRGLWGAPGGAIFAVGEGGTILACGASPAPPAPPSGPNGPDTTPRPLIQGLSDESGRPGERLAVSITGINLGRATAVDFGPGITVTEFTVISDSRIVACIAIESEAASGSRAITVTTPGGLAMAPGSFLVLEADEGAPSRAGVAAAAAGSLAAVGALALLALGLRRRAARRARR